MTTQPYAGPRAGIGIIGGSGLYSLLDGETVEVETPYGAPSDPLTIAEVAGRRVAFVPRHGLDHRFPPHRVNYRANIWALRAVGARQVLGPCAVGSLEAEHGAGTVVVPDQLVDRTWGRAHTFFDEPGSVVHLPFADPYCPHVSAAVAAADQEVKVGGAMVVIEGPRFSTRAESRHYAEQGWALINMTGAPEAALAREMRMCYAAIALVTDMDAGAESGEGVSQEEVFALFRANLDRLGTLLTSAIARLPDPEGCECSTWADGIDLTYGLPGESS
jgi:5'-methylthioadenosine phosphorylase